MLPVLLAVIVALLAAGGVWYYFFHAGNPRSEQNVVAAPTTTSTAIAVSTTTTILWNANPALIKTIPFSTSATGTENYTGVINVYNIGTFEGGAYEGKIVALGTYDLTNVSNPGSGRNVIYAYFIADNSGNTIAWSPNFVQDNTGCIPDYEICPYDGVEAALGFTLNPSSTLNVLPNTLATCLRHTHMAD
jgi:hypothetical protein